MLIRVFFPSHLEALASSEAIPVESKAPVSRNALSSAASRQTGRTVLSANGGPRLYSHDGLRDVLADLEREAGNAVWTEPAGYFNRWASLAAAAVAVFLGAGLLRARAGRRAAPLLPGGSRVQPVLRRGGAAPRGRRAAARLLATVLRVGRVEGTGGGGKRGGCARSPR